ncbi:MAG: hypothetical protein AB7F43_14030 [Bacteriovoracia bacterium]
MRYLRQPVVLAFVLSFLLGKPLYASYAQLLAKANCLRQTCAILLRPKVQLGKIVLSDQVLQSILDPFTKRKRIDVTLFFLIEPNRQEPILNLLEQNGIEISNSEHSYSAPFVVGEQQYTPKGPVLYAAHGKPKFWFRFLRSLVRQVQLGHVDMESLQIRTSPKGPWLTTGEFSFNALNAEYESRLAEIERAFREQEKRH